jgi:A/G-specific adenine glycosylase
MKEADRAAAFGGSMWAWYRRHKRTLPWRDLQVADDTHRAYLILVSEVMLQQTQVPRVIGAFKRFIERFPTITDLARASNKDVILAWKGMGYNSRALRLRDAAKDIVHAHGGVFPKDYDALLVIDGIGPYTASAVRNFAFNLPTSCVDTNIHRILHRVFVGPEPEKNDRATQKRVMALAGETLRIALENDKRRNERVAGGDKRVAPEENSVADRYPLPATRSTADWHAALMDFGSIVCTKSSPRCEACPLSQGTCKSAFRIKAVKRDKKASTEPGRMIAGRFVPNRIIRGRIVDALRDAHAGLDAEAIGRTVAPDWAAEHRAWLDAILAKLVVDRLLVARGGLYELRE